MTEFSTWLAKYIAHGVNLERNFDSPKGIIEYCQSLREFWIPSDTNGDRLASIVLGSLINDMCDAIRIAGGTPPVTPQTISSVDEGMRAIDLIVEWCKSQEAADLTIVCYDDEHPGYLTSEVKELTGLENSALNDYREKADVPKPRNGQGNFRQSRSDLVKLLHTIVSQCNRKVVRETSQSSLETLSKLSQSSRKIGRSLSFKS